MLDPIILLISFIFLMALIRPFFMPGATVDDSSSVFSVLVFVLSIMIYFFGIDPFPASLPDISALTLVFLAAIVAAVLIESVMAFFVTLVAGIAVVTYFGWVFTKIPLGALHILVVGMINAMAILDVFFKSVFGVPLSPDFFIYYLIPATFMYKFSKSLLNYVAFFSERTVNFISFVMAFLMLESIVTKTMNPVTLVLDLVTWIVGLFAGDLLKLTMGIFVLALSITILSVALETIAIVVTSWAIGDVSGGGTPRAQAASSEDQSFNPPV